MNNRRTRSEKNIDDLLLQFNSDYLQYSNHLNGYTKISKDEMKKIIVNLVFKDLDLIMVVQ